LGGLVLNRCQPALSFVIALAENAQAYFSGNSSFVIRHAGLRFNVCGPQIVAKERTMIRLWPYRIVHKIYRRDLFGPRSKSISFRPF